MNNNDRMSILKNGLVKTLNPKNIGKELITWQKREWVLLIAMLAAQAAAFIAGADYGTMGWIGLLTGIMTVLNLILVDRGRITNYVWGFIGCIIWLIVAVHNNLIGDIFSQSFYVAMQIFGVYFWEKDLENKNKADAAVTEVTAHKMTAWQVAIALVGTLIVYAIVVNVSIRNGGSQVWLDGTLLPLGIVGQVLMTYGYRSQWVAWIVLDAINVVIWFNQLAAGGPAATSMFVLQIVMLINALYGCWVWFHQDAEKK